MNRRTFGLAWIGTAVAAAAGCSGGGGDGPALDVQGTGSLSFAITDAPIDDAAAVVLAMTELELKPAGEQPFKVPVIGAPRELDLTDFTDGETADILVDEEVPAGDYEWMRIFFDESLSYIQLESDGTQYSFFMPSGAQTGFKLVGGFAVPLNGHVAYILDFDVRKSVLEPPGLAGPLGEARRFLLRPTVRIMNAAETGGVTGVVASELLDLNNERCLLAEPEPLTGNAVYVFPGADAMLDDVAEEDADDGDGDDSGDGEGDGVPGPLTSDVVDLNPETGEYEYHLMFLLPGTYTLAFTCSAMADGAGDDDFPPAEEGSGFDFDATINVDIVAGEVKTCDIPPSGEQGDPC